MVQIRGKEPNVLTLHVGMQIGANFTIVDLFHTSDGFKQQILRNLRKAATLGTRGLSRARREFSETALEKCLAPRVQSSICILILTKFLMAKS